MVEEPGVPLGWVHMPMGRSDRSLEMLAVGSERRVPMEYVDMSKGSPIRSIGMLAVGSTKWLSLECERDVQYSRRAWSLGCLEVGEGARMSLECDDHFERSDEWPPQVLSMADLPRLPLESL